MTGPEHYRMAQALLEKASELPALDPVALAQVHATLALAAATALATKPSSAAQMREWAAAIGDPYDS